MKTFNQNVQTLLSRQDLAKRWNITPQAILNYEQQGILTRNPNIPTPRYNLIDVERIENSSESDKKEENKRNSDKRERSCVVL